jgi:peptide/histidine transporter 3/4
MGLFSIVSVVIGAPTYAWLIAPWIARRGIGPKEELSPVERMGIGIVTAIAAFSAAAIVESWRLRIAHMRDLDDDGGGGDDHDHDHDHHKAMSIFWLAPQYVLAGFTTLFFGAGNLDFNHANLAPGLRSLATAAFLSAMSLGSFGSSLIVSSVSSFTSWLPPDLNSGHLDYFYWLLVALLVLAAALFAISSHSHSRRIATPLLPPIGLR